MLHCIIRHIVPEKIRTGQQRGDFQAPGRVLSAGGVGEASPQTSQLPLPPQKKVLLKKKFTAISNKDLFNDDFKESVKVLMSRNAISANPEHYIFKIVQGSMPPDPARRPNKNFSPPRGSKFLSGSTSPPNKKS